MSTDDPRDDYGCAACLFASGPVHFATWADRCVNATSDGTPCDGAPFVVMIVKPDAGPPVTSTLCRGHYERAIAHLDGVKLIAHLCGMTTNNEIDDSTTPT